MSLLLRNCILHGDVVNVSIRDGHVAGIEAGDGAGFGAAPPEDLSEARAHDRTIDATGLHLFPSLKNGHTHAAMTLFRGYGDDLPLQEWLEERIWPAEAKMTPEHVHAGTRLGLLEMIRSGTTFLNDMYWHTRAIARAVNEMGVRAHLGSVFIDLGDPEVEARWKKSVERDLEAKDDLGPLIRLTIAPHAIYSVSAKNLEWLGDAAREHGLLLHIHLSETLKEVEDCLESFECRPAHLLDRLGLLGDNLVAAHGVYLDAGEFEVLGEAGATVVHNPCANLKLATGGILDIPAATRAGVNVVLGTDGVGSNNSLDLFDEMKFAALLQKHRARKATVLPAHEAMALATTHPARTFGLGSGEVAVGEPADLILVDLRRPETQPLHDPVSDLVYAANGSCVHTTICAGRVLMHDRRVEVVDEAEVVEAARAAAKELVG